MTDRHDIRAVIARAAELKHESEDTLRPEQLREVAAELGIEAEFVDAAVADLERRHAERGAAQQQRAHKRKRQRVLVTSAVAASLVIGTATVALSVSSARALWAQVEQQQAAVADARKREAETQALWGNRMGEQDADAELAGALNRVHIAHKRYDEAASAWNARGLIDAIGGALLDLPKRAQLSPQRTSW